MVNYAPGATGVAFWPLVFSINFEQNLNVNRIAYYYNDPDNASTGFTYLNWNIVPQLLSTQPVYTSYPDITTLTMCSTNQIPSGTGSETNTCAGGCGGSFCYNATQKFWCPETSNTYLGKLDL